MLFSLLNFPRLYKEHLHDTCRKTILFFELHCPRNYLNLRMKTKPKMDAVCATEYSMSGSIHDGLGDGRRF